MLSPAQKIKQGENKILGRKVNLKDDGQIRPSEEGTSDLIPAWDAVGGPCWPVQGLQAGPNLEVYRSHK